MSISKNIQSILDHLPESVKLVAVSKTKPVEDIFEAYNGGYKIFGENKPQELKQKYEALPKDIEWHMIGHLQTNKVKYIASFVRMIHAVDSFKLANIINKEAAKNDRIINCLLQLHIAEEDSKFGFSIEEVINLLNSEEFKNMKNIRICGVMGMATYTDDIEQIRREFAGLKTNFSQIKERFFTGNECFKEVSMGMSGDYKLAVNEGSTIVRVGSSIFGDRNYKKKEIEQ